MPLDGTAMTQRLSTSAGAADNLSAACTGILTTHMAPSGSHWYGTLNAQLQQAQGLASQWRDQLAGKLRADVFGCIVHCGQQFQASRAAIAALFQAAAQDPAGARAPLQGRLEELKRETEMISTAVSGYAAQLKSWGQHLQQVHDAMAATIQQVQHEAADLRAQIGAINSQIAAMQAEMARDRKAIAEAKSQRDRGIAETVFGVVLAPFTEGLSLILAGIGVSSIAEAESKISAMESTIKNYQARIVSGQQNLNQDQAQLATLQALILPAGIALGDIETAGQMLDAVRTEWDAFFQEMGGVTGKIASAESAAAMAVEQAWFNAACNEWDLVVTGAQGVIGAPFSSRSVNCTHCDVAVIRVVPTPSHPPLPSGLKMTVLADPGRLDPAPTCQVLT